MVQNHRTLIDRLSRHNTEQNKGGFNTEVPVFGTQSIAIS
jgi:hypothetical protein